MNNGTAYKEVRQYRMDHHLIRFYFVTRVFSRYMESILTDFETGMKPDLVIVNSCVWDISRWECSSLQLYTAIIYLECHNYFSINMIFVLLQCTGTAVNGQPHIKTTFTHSSVN